MKRSAVAFAIGICTLFVSCKKEKKVDVETNAVPTAEKFAIDSLSLKDSLVMSPKLSLEYRSEVLVFPTVTEKALQDSIYFIYKGVTDYSKNGLQNFLQKDKDDYFNDTKSRSKDWLADIAYKQTWYTSFKMKQISHKNDFLQVEYLSSAYEGGAHDNYWFSNRVFDLKTNKKLVLSDITTMPENKISQILKKNMDKIHSGTTDSRGDVKNSDMLLVDVIEPNENFYFDDKNLYFHYSPYEIAAFAAGEIVIPVSWMELHGTVKPEFEKRLKSN